MSLARLPTLAVALPPGWALSVNTTVEPAPTARPAGSLVVNDWTILLVETVKFQSQRSGVAGFVGNRNGDGVRPAGQRFRGLVSEQATASPPHLQ